MFLVSSFFGFELGMSSIRFIQQPYSEYAFHKNWNDIGQKTAEALWLKKDEYRYYWDQEMFIQYLTTLHPSTLSKLIDVMNTFMDMKLHHTGKSILYESEKTNIDLQAIVIDILKYARKKHNTHS